MLRRGRDGGRGGGGQEEVGKARKHNARNERRNWQSAWDTEWVVVEEIRSAPRTILWCMSRWWESCWASRRKRGRDMPSLWKPPSASYTEISPNILVPRRLMWKIPTHSVDPVELVPKVVVELVHMRRQSKPPQPHQLDPGAMHYHSRLRRTRSTSGRCRRSSPAWSTAVE
jgi:hypothetical protein